MGGRYWRPAIQFGLGVGRRSQKCLSWTRLAGHVPTGQCPWGRPLGVAVDLYRPHQQAGQRKAEQGRGQPLKHLIEMFLQKLKNSVGGS